MSQVPVTQKIFDFIGVSTLALEKGAAMLDAYQQKEAAARELIPQVVEALVEGDRIAPEDREKVAELLQDPVESLKLLAKVAMHRNFSEAQLGSPATQRKSASADETERAAVARLYAAFGVTPVFED